MEHCRGKGRAAGPGRIGGVDQPGKLKTAYVPCPPEREHAYLLAFELLGRRLAMLAGLRGDDLAVFEDLAPVELEIDEELLLELEVEV